ncbi:MAG: hypothetical protein EXR83_15680 [Gammaproteobacteria bacterium]|nr:hypothetical protein [Gammaproteobacteria bacterium]
MLTYSKARNGRCREEVKLGHGRPLAPRCPILYPDRIRADVRAAGAVRTRAARLAIGINLDGRKELLG